MNLVLFTKNDTLKQFLKKVIPDSLSQVLLDKEQELTKFLDDLKIPTQVILDVDSYKKDLKSLMKKNSRHHFVCLSHKITFASSMELIKQGGILTSCEHLSLIDWWWNRTQIKFQHKKVDAIGQKAVLFIPNLQSQRAKIFIQRQLWKFFYQTKPLTINFNGSEKFSSLIQKAQHFFTPLINESPQSPVLVTVNQLSQMSPHSFRELLKYYQFLENTLHNLKMLLYFDMNHENFDRAFDNCSSLLQSRLFRCDCSKIEKYLDEILAHSEANRSFESIIEYLSIEEIQHSSRRIEG